MKKTILMCVAVLLCLTGCRHKNPHNTLPKDGNAVYYWQTWYSTNHYEDNFLAVNNIKTMYVRFFDVELNRKWDIKDKCSPVATIYIPNGQPLRDFNVVPVIFITPEAIKEYKSFTDHLAHRIYAMCVKNTITINEVQFDCDWTKSTRDDYFQFLVDVRKALKNYFGRDIAVSSTIRLHQLAQTPPAVDYGVLMCYNTGDFKKFKTQNAILDVTDVQPYAKHLQNYALPLKLALPVYSWDVEFDANKNFIQLNSNNYCFDNYDSSCLKNLGHGMYEILGTTFPDRAVKYIRHETVSAKTILEAKTLMEKYYGKMPVVLYHLDSIQLSKYNNDEIKAFFD